MRTQSANTGFGLGYLGPGLGVRAAALTTIVLTIMFVAAQEWSRTSLDVGLAPALLTAILSTLGQFAFSILIYLAPLMVGSVYGNSRFS